VNVFQDFFSLIFPNRCLLTDEPLQAGEKWVSTGARLSLPLSPSLTDHHRVLCDKIISDIEVFHLIACYQFQKGGLVQELLNQIKYRGQRNLTRMTGRWFGQLLEAYGHQLELDYLIPVPIHPKKKRERGYNQAAELACGISDVLGIPVENQIIQKVKETRSQTKQSRVDRWNSVMESMKILDPSKIEGKRMAIIDDVMTTGSTMEAVMQSLLPHQPASLSGLVLAHALYSA